MNKRVYLKEASKQRPITSEDWENYLNDILGRMKDAYGYPYYVENYSLPNNWEVVVQAKHANKVEQILANIQAQFPEIFWKKREAPYEGSAMYYIEADSPSSEDMAYMMASAEEEFGLNRSKKESVKESSRIENERVITTGLTGKKNEEILESVIGQLSDGIWENSPRMERYWENAEIRNESDNISIIVNGNKWEGGNGFRNMSDDEVRKFFADKIKQIIKIEIEDYKDSKDGIKGGWTRDNKEVSGYIGYDEEITVSDCYKAYEILLNRNVAGRYSESVVEEFKPGESAIYIDSYGGELPVTIIRKASLEDAPEGSYKRSQMMGASQDLTWYIVKYISTHMEDEWIESDYRLRKTGQVKESTLTTKYILVGDREDMDGFINRGITIGEYDDYDDARAAYKEYASIDSDYFNLEIIDLENGLDEEDEEDYMMEESSIKEGTGNFKMSSKGFPTYVMPEVNEGEDEDFDMAEYEELVETVEYFNESELPSYMDTVIQEISEDETMIPEDEVDFVMIEFGGHIKLVVEPGYYSSYSLSIQEPYEVPTNRDVEPEVMKYIRNKMADAAVKKASELAQQYGLKKIDVSARFSSGETWYNYSESLNETTKEDRDMYEEEFIKMFNNIEVTDGTYTMRMMTWPNSPYYGYIMDGEDTPASEHGEIQDLFPDYRGRPSKDKFANYNVVGTDLKLWEYLFAVSDYLFLTYIQPEDLEDEELYDKEMYELGKKLLNIRGTSNDEFDWDAEQFEESRVSYVDKHDGVTIHKHDDTGKYMAGVYAKTLTDEDLNSLKRKIEDEIEKHRKHFQDLGESTTYEGEILKSEECEKHYVEIYEDENQYGEPVYLVGVYGKPNNNVISSKEFKRPEQLEKAESYYNSLIKRYIKKDV